MHHRNSGVDIRVDDGYHSWTSFAAVDLAKVKCNRCKELSGSANDTEDLDRHTAGYNVVIHSSEILKWNRCKKFAGGLWISRKNRMAQTDNVIWIKEGPNGKSLDDHVELCEEQFQ